MIFTPPDRTMTVRETGLIPNDSRLSALNNRIILYAMTSEMVTLRSMVIPDVYWLLSGGADEDTEIIQIEFETSPRRAEHTSKYLYYNAALNEKYHTSVKLPPPKIYHFVIYGAKVNRCEPVDINYTEHRFRTTSTWLREVDIDKLYAIMDEKIAKSEKSTLMEFFTLLNVEESKEFIMDEYLKMVRYLNNHTLFDDRLLVNDVFELLCVMFFEKMTEEQKEFVKRSEVMISPITEAKEQGWQEGRQQTLLDQIANHLAKGTPREKLTDVLCVTENELEKLLKLHDAGYGNGGNGKP
jgi:hypothetical protein